MQVCATVMEFNKKHPTYPFVYYESVTINQSTTDSDALSVTNILLLSVAYMA